MAAPGETTTAALQHHVHPADGHNPSASALPRNTQPGLGLPPSLGVGRTVSPRSTSPSATATTTTTSSQEAPMTSVHWGTSPHQKTATTGTTATTASAPTSAFPNKATGNPVVIAASGIRVPTGGGGQTAAAQFSMGSGGNSSANSSSKKAGPSPQNRAKPHHANAVSKNEPVAAANNNSNSSNNNNNSSSNSNGSSSGTGTNRRQKRLERNRESARLSRRRRKQYLEVLEERVNMLSIEMDKGRREHVSKSIKTIVDKRNVILQDPHHNGVPLLTGVLSRTSNELRVAATFQSQQLQSLSLPPETKFLLWLTLQNDNYFRGGRAASERLSAARIGERMLTSGNDKVPPSQGMWPLICNEVGLSYDQEERARGFQRTLLQENESWIDRHTAAASKLTMDSAHDCLQAIHHNVGQRERSVLGSLDESKRAKFLAWALKRKDKLAELRKKREKTSSDMKMDDGDSRKPDLSPGNHVAANLYILNRGLQTTLKTLPQPPLLVKGPLKKLSRRPSFESLGSCGATEKEGSRPLHKDHSSSGSLKRSSDALSGMTAEGDEDRMATQNNICPEEAQTTAAPVIEAALGIVKDLVVQPKPITTATTTPNATVAAVMGAPDHVVSSNAAVQSAMAVPGQPTNFSPIIINPQEEQVKAQQQQQQQQQHHQLPPPSQPVLNTYDQPTTLPSQPLHHPGTYTSTPMPEMLHSNQDVAATSLAAPLHAPPPQQQQPMQPQPMQPQPTFEQYQQPNQQQQQQQPQQQREFPSFLPPNLNVVPEENFLPGTGNENDNDDFLFDLTEEDWAIGGAFDIDTA
eukprot:CAMPEP_0195282006 /NCGR_PEP_ID=MMETSP0707-20130614/1079_1 /TAXON_ID=33640 /ORGANISM="Asterionellopsis glacialis, Strain CCMP134" /LENGTH=805 /DNA_ID=CAMNT_0040340955 /DNA_START=214 /DNA_END=2631 /DNA_ORIENTATION=-